MMLTREKVQHFHRDGFLVVEGALSRAELSEVRSVVDQFVEDSRELTWDNASFVLEPSHSRTSPRLARINQPVKVHPVFDSIMRSSAVLDRVADLIGPDIRYHHSKLNMKTSGVGSPVEWHQDFVFFPH